MSLFNPLSWFEGYYAKRIQRTQHQRRIAEERKRQDNIAVVREALISYTTLDKNLQEIHLLEDEDAETRRNRIARWNAANGNQGRQITPNYRSEPPELNTAAGRAAAEARVRAAFMGTNFDGAIKHLEGLVPQLQKHGGIQEAALVGFFIKQLLEWRSWPQFEFGKTNLSQTFNHNSDVVPVDPRTIRQKSEAELHRLAGVMRRQYIPQPPKRIKRLTTAQPESVPDAVKA